MRLCRAEVEQEVKEEEKARAREEEKKRKEEAKRIKKETKRLEKELKRKRKEKLTKKKDLMGELLKQNDAMETVRSSTELQIKKGVKNKGGKATSISRIRLCVSIV